MSARWDTDDLQADAPSATRVDLLFPVRGGPLPRDHRALLARAVGGRLPWLGGEPGTGVLDMNLVAGGGAQALLSGRTRLVVRVPRERADEAGEALADAVLDLDGHLLTLGRATRRELLLHRTLYAHFVAARPGDDELAFLAAVDAELDRLGAACRPVCGRRQTLRGEAGTLTGFSLMLDGLAPAHALRVLDAGLGAHGRLGCGLFVPHRSAAAVGS